MVGMKEDYSLFHISYATDDYDLDFVIAIFRIGTHIDKEIDQRRGRLGT